MKPIKFPLDNVNTQVICPNHRKKEKKKLCRIALSAGKAEEKVRKICKNLKSTFPSTQQTLVAINYIALRVPTLALSFIHNRNLDIVNNKC